MMLGEQEDVFLVSEADETAADQRPSGELEAPCASSWHKRARASSRLV